MWCRWVYGEVVLILARFSRHFRTNTSEVCEGKGECICGSCDCYPISKDPSQKYRGDYCECNDFSCDYFDNMICGGEFQV